MVKNSPNGLPQHLQKRQYQHMMKTTSKKNNAQKVGHITRFSVAPRSPSKLGSVPPMVHRSSSSGCFVADTRCVCCMLLYTRR